MHKLVEKTCTKCGETRPASAFIRRKWGKGYFYLQPCIPCRELLAVSEGRVSENLQKKTHKRCNVCNEMKPISEFFPNSPSHGGGYRQPCRKCTGIILTEKNRQRRLKDQTFATNEKQTHARSREKHRDEIRIGARAYYRKNPEKFRANDERRRAREAGAPFFEYVDLDVLYQRDKGICQICYKKCLRKDASGDHVIPLSLGGSTSYQNMVLAHLACNRAKGNRVVQQQQRLFG
jgi:5-methylcytosine-specific restriction endonuclease McrA